MTTCEKEAAILAQWDLWQSGNPTQSQPPLPDGATELRLWRMHRDLIKAVPVEETYRGCIGLAMSFDDARVSEHISRGHQTYIPDRDVLWHTLQSLPRGRWATTRGRDVDLAVVHRTTMSCGLPSIGSIAQRLGVYDLRRMPGSPATPAVAPEVIDPHSHAMQVFNALAWAVTTTAFAYRTSWAAYKPKLYSLLGVAPKAVPHLLFGDGVYDTVQPPGAWMPTPMLGFPAAAAPDLFQRATQPGAVSQQTKFTNAFQSAFVRSVTEGLPVLSPVAGYIVRFGFGTIAGFPCREWHIRQDDDTVCVVQGGHAAVMLGGIGDRVEVGQCIGSDVIHLPVSAAASVHAKWTALRSVLQGYMPAMLRMWFNRQQVKLKSDYVHMPLSLCEAAALGSSVESLLYWQLHDDFAYFSPSANAFIFPTVRTRAWDALQFTLAGVAVDLLPAADPRFVSCGRSRTEIGA